MKLIHKLCTRLGHPMRQLLRCDVHLDGHFSRTRWYKCRVCGEVVREEET